MLLFHVIVAAILLPQGLPVGYWPPGQLAMSGLFALGVAGGVIVVLVLQLIADARARQRGRAAVARFARIKAACGRLGAGLGLAVVFQLAMLANANLKPALFVLRPRAFDAELEAVERWLCGGVLPTEWIVRHWPAWSLRGWDWCYALFAPFLLISLLLTLHREGLRGGARYVLGLSACLLTTLLAALALPSRGPIYVHPDWFGAIEGGYSLNLAHQLALSVEQYAAEPAVRYPVAGISAMPSYHVMAWLCAYWFCWRGLPRLLVLAAIVMNALNWACTFALGWHYALDGVVGALLTIPLCWMAARLIPSASGREQVAGGACA